jgi:hypothetical protein
MATLTDLVFLAMQRDAAFLSPVEVALIKRCSVDTVSRREREWGLESVRDGRRKLYTAESVRKSLSVTK